MRLLVFLTFSTFLSLFCKAQDSESGPGYQLILINNPALSGSEGDGIVRLAYHNYYPGNNFNLHSVYFSYDSYVPSLHGGIGIYEVLSMILRVVYRMHIFCRRGRICLLMQDFQPRYYIRGIILVGRFYLIRLILLEV
jgi:hypothetical protein